MAKSLSIFGVSGSIGASVLKIIESDPSAFEVDTICAGSNLEKLVEIARRTRARHVILNDETCYEELKIQLPDAEVAVGEAAIEEAAHRPVDVCLNAIIGAAGLPVSVGAMGNAKILALANKESLVCAGKILMKRAREKNTEIVPVDSEHSAIFQCLRAGRLSEVNRLILTASGGPFRTWSRAELEKVRVADALQHPSWEMGERITIDSASMFNKALEMIEAYELFRVNPQQIDVLVHPQSIVHSIIEFVDGGSIAQMGVPDMRHAIGFAIHYPARKPTGVQGLDLAQIQNLTFEAADFDRFKPLHLAKHAMKMDGVAGAVLNAAKETALDAFIGERIGFLQMADVVEGVLLSKSWKQSVESLDDVYDADKEARNLSNNIVNKIG